MPLQGFSGHCSIGLRQRWFDTLRNITGTEKPFYEENRGWGLTDYHACAVMENKAMPIGRVDQFRLRHEQTIRRKKTPTFLRGFLSYN